MMTRKFAGILAVAVFFGQFAADASAQGPLTRAAKGLNNSLKSLDPTTNSVSDIIPRAAIGVPVATHLVPLITTGQAISNVGRGRNPDAPLQQSTSQLSTVAPRTSAIVFPSGGRVRKQATGWWTEVGMDGRFVCNFRELHQDGNYIVLREDQRRFNLVIPKAGGMILWQNDGSNRMPWGPVRFE